MTKPGNRRRFLLMTLGAAGGAAAFARLSSLRGSRQTDQRAGTDSGDRLVTHTRHALGTAVSITAVHRDEQAGSHAIHEAFAALDRLEDRLSIYRPHSELARLNRNGLLDQPHADLVRVLQSAAALSEQTSGAFDVSVQPLWSLFAEADRRGRRPSPQAIAEAKQLVDYRQVTVTSEQIALTRPGMALTLNGIAQGFAADRVSEVLRKHGVTAALIDTGELAPLGRRDRRAWRVGVQHPRKPDAFIAIAALEGRCMATSGDYATRFKEPGNGARGDHHIFDPGTGRSPDALASATVVAPTGMHADAISTAVFVMGPGRGMELVRATEGVDALLVTRGGRVLQTPGFPEVSV